MTEPEISVVIPTLGNHDVLRRVLDGYARQTAPPGSFELLVVADPAEPDVATVRAAVGDRPYPVTLLLGDRPGPSANRNRGAGRARAGLVLFTDSDTVPCPALVAEHVAWHRRDPAPEVTVIGPVQWARGIPVTPFMRWLEYGIQFDFHAIRGTEATWAHVYSANCSITRTLWDRVGGYDAERLPYGYEDLDWGYRAREHGLRVAYNRRAVVEHWRTMSVADWQARAPRLAVSEARFCALHPDVPPWFHRMFAEAAAVPPGGARSAAAARFVPRWVPWLGPVVWERAGLHWRQEIAGNFLPAWEAAQAGTAPELQPSVSAFAERSASSGGSAPGGPK